LGKCGKRLKGYKKLEKFEENQKKFKKVLKTKKMFTANGIGTRGTCINENLHLKIYRYK